MGSRMKVWCCKSRTRFTDYDARYFWLMNYFCCGMINIFLSWWKNHITFILFKMKF